MKRPTTYIKGNRCLLRQLAMRGLLNVRQGSKKHRFITKGARVLAYLPALKLTPFMRPKTMLQKYKKYFNMI